MSNKGGACWKIMLDFNLKTKEFLWRLVAKECFDARSESFHSFFNPLKYLIFCPNINYLSQKCWCDTSI